MQYLPVFFLALFINATQGQVHSFHAYKQEIPGSSLSISMVPIKGGEFKMGSSKNEKGRNEDEGPIHPVMVDDFWMSNLEISWNQFELFLTRRIDHAGSPKGSIELDIDGVSGATMPYMNLNKSGYPAVNITQYAASQFCKWLTAKTGHYYRLPTEAEWEHACRAGHQRVYSFGNQSHDLHKYGWYKKNSGGKLKKSKLKISNGNGLYDMHGNAAEWVLDSYDPKGYIDRQSGANNPLKKKKAIYPRVVRGGSFKDEADQLRSASRGFSKKRWKERDPQIPKSLWWQTDATHVGFRIIRPRITPPRDELKNYWVLPKKEF